MKGLLASVFVFFQFVIVAEAQESFTAHGSALLYTPPDSSNWFIVNNGIDERSQKYLPMFRRKPIEDTQGRRVHPVIAVICEPIKEPLVV